MSGKRADFIAVRDIRSTPAQTLAQLTSADVELVVLEGSVQVASPTLYARLTQHHRSGLHLLGFDHEKFTFRHAGRDFRLTDVHGTVIRDLIA